MLQPATSNGRRFVSQGSTAAKEESLSSEFQDLESQSSLTGGVVPEEVIKSYDPVKRAKSRRKELPRSRYVLLPVRKLKC